MIIIKSKSVSGSLKTQDESDVPLLKWIEREADFSKKNYFFCFVPGCTMTVVSTLCFFWLRLYDGLLFFISLSLFPDLHSSHFSYDGPCASSIHFPLTVQILNLCL